MNADATSSTAPADPEPQSAVVAPVDPREPAIRAAFDELRNAIDRVERAMLLALPADPLPTTVPLVRRDVMKPREYAEYMRVNVRKVHGWIHAGMPHFLVEGRIRIRVGDADNWLETQDKKPLAKPDGKPQKKTEKKPTRRKTVRTRKPKPAPEKSKTKRGR